MMLLLLLAIDVNFQILRDDSLNPVVRVVYTINYNELTFISMDSAYTSKYRVSLVVFNGKRQVGGVSKVRKFSVNRYETTISAEKTDTGEIQFAFKEKGKFRAIFELWDLNSLRHWSKEKKFEVKDVKNLTLGEVNWNRSVSKIFSTDDTISLRLNIFNPRGDSVVLLFTVKNPSGSEFIKEEEFIGKKRFFTHNIDIPASRFSEGEYLADLMIKGYPSGKKSKKSIDFKVQKPFFESRRFIERAREMAYIAKKSFIDSLIKADPDERKKLWEGFWNEKDPTPGTEKNEFLEEYYRRVDFANQHFRSPFSPGWRTDRGRVYIKLGPPDSIERHPFDINTKAYEVWYYYTLGYRLIFVDEYNLGDYTLVNPPREDL